MVHNNFALIPLKRKHYSVLCVGVTNYKLMVLLGLLENVDPLSILDRFLLQIHHG